MAKTIDSEDAKDLPALTEQQKKQIACSEEIRGILAKYDLAFSVHPGNIVLVERPEDMKDKITSIDRTSKEDKKE
jgi:hypothetical protein